MTTRAGAVTSRDMPREDHYVHLYGVTWADYLRLLEIRGERSDQIKSYIGCLVEA